MITIFLRKTTGKGEKLQISPKITSQALCAEVQKVLNYPSSEDGQSHTVIDCYYRGVKLEQDSQEGIEDLGITGNSIIHVVETPVGNEEFEETASIHVKLIIKNKLF